ncbi:MAG: hypothetical protein AAF790_09070 [Planctomycetota bacterium]
MAMHAITLEELRDFYDGKVAVQFNRMIAAAIADCVDRPGVDKGRKVTVTVELKPQTDEAGECYNVETTATCKSTVPNFGSAPVVCQVRKISGAKHGERYQAVFNDMSPDNPDQQTFE